MESKTLDRLKFSVGGVSNHYGGLYAVEHDGKFYWAIEDFMGFVWEEIPKSLFEELKKF